MSAAPPAIRRGLRRQSSAGCGRSALGASVAGSRFIPVAQRARENGRSHPTLVQRNDKPCLIKGKRYDSPPLPPLDGNGSPLVGLLVALQSRSKLSQQALAEECRGRKR